MKNICLLLAVSLLTIISACSSKQNETSLKLWYNSPAKYWMSEALPIGNGYVGAMIMGGINADSLQFSYEGLWSGGPVEGHPYNYGIKKDAKNHLPAVRNLLAQNKQDEAHTIANTELTGKINPEFNKNCSFGDYGANQNMGTLIIKPNHKGQVENYRRELDIENSLASVTYQMDKAKYKRTYFASYPNKAIVYRYQSDQPLSYKISFQTPHKVKVFDLKNSVLTITGQLEDNHREFTIMYELRGVDDVIVNGNVINITNTSDLQICQITGSDYINKFPDYLDVNYKEKLIARLKNIKAKSYKQLKETHINDYQNLFARVDLKLEGVSNGFLPTNERLEKYNEDKKDLGLLNLYFQYSRYLMISGSRPGTMPLHLQGKWNNLTNPMWACDYHFNINLQMCYWPAEITNLGECHEPLLDYLQTIQEPGQLAAKEFFNTRGWIVNTMNNAYGFAAPGWRFPWGFFPGGAAWSCRHLWEHYEFNQDTTFLREKAYPLMKDASLFWIDYLQDNNAGSLVSMPSYSPEHGGISKGANMDHQMAWDLLNNLQKAHDVLNIENDFAKTVKEVKNRIIKPQIGNWGQLQEWVEDVDDASNKHRHVSHLYALYPGAQINIDQTPELAEAARTSLNARGDGGTGWSRGWKINFWARLKDGNRSLELINALLDPVEEARSGMTGGTYSNLLCAHPPFQLDGNMGGAAGMAEMLVQSHNGVMELLPALPSQWQSGSVKGLKCRNGIQVDITWKNRKVINATFSSKQNYKGIALINGEEIAVKCTNTNSFKY